MQKNDIVRDFGNSDIYALHSSQQFQNILAKVDLAKYLYLTSDS